MNKYPPSSSADHISFGFFHILLDSPRGRSAMAAMPNLAILSTSGETSVSAILIRTWLEPKSIAATLTRPNALMAAGVHLTPVLGGAASSWRRSIASSSGSASMAISVGRTGAKACPETKAALGFQSDTCLVGTRR